MQPKQLLVVEDNDILRKTLERYLARQGVKVTTTRTVAGARDLLTSHRFDAMLVDINLPDDCGLDLVAPSSESAVPVVAMTAEDPTRYRQRASDTGVAAFLEKPFALMALYRILKCVFAGHRCLPYCTQLPHLKITPTCTQP
ncbi:MAG: response regulator [Gammaproteobacteria bacterium]|nr:response regulator [Gammaproteobacteria bacterium]MDH3449013.1 response regulator [Gammaproteobacteria bacterium]